MDRGYIDRDFARDGVAGLSDALLAFYPAGTFPFCEPEARDFVVKVLGEEIERTMRVSDTGRFVDLVALEDLALLRSSLIDIASSLPWHYTVAYPVCRFDTCHFQTSMRSSVAFETHGGMYIPDSETLLGLTMEAIPLGPSRTLSKGLPGWENATGDGDWLWLQAQVAGYWPREFVAALLESVAREARSISGILLACNLLEYARTSEMADHVADAPASARLGDVYCRIRGEATLQGTIRLGVAESREIFDTRWTERFVVSERSDEEPSPESVARLSTELRDRLLFLQPLFDVTSNSEFHKGKGQPSDWRARMRLAAYWFAVSQMQQANPLNQFVFLMLGYEALLGDPGVHDRIQGRIADRAAFLIGESIQERDQVSRRFRAAYELRSQIFHEGRMDVSTAEVWAFEKPPGPGLGAIFRRCMSTFCAEFGYRPVGALPRTNQGLIH